MKQDNLILFANKCKEIRKKTETVRSISEKTDISTSCIINFEKSGKFNLSSLIKYADALGCHLELVPNNKSKRKQETQAPADPQSLTDAERVELENLRRMKSIIKEVIK